MLLVHNMFRGFRVYVSVVQIASGTCNYVELASAWCRWFCVTVFTIVLPHPLNSMLEVPFVVIADSVTLLCRLICMRFLHMWFRAVPH